MNIHAWRLALALALTSAISLGLARFAYALVLPPMRADLGWTYFLSGAMNTANALGYLVGALMSRRWLTRFDAQAVLLTGGLGAVLTLCAHGLWVPQTHAGAAVATEAISGSHNVWLAAMRLASGVASAAMFVAGGVLAARLASRASRVGDAQEKSHAGLILGIYYGGTGLGIVLSTALVPWVITWSTPHAWRWAWVGLGLMALLALVTTARLMTGKRGALLLAPPATSAAPTPSSSRFPWRNFWPSLAGYFCFGLGYIGYMTFVITLLREQQLPPKLVVVFFALLGLGVMASSGLWANLLQHHRNGRPMMQLNGLLAVATVLPVLSTHPLAVLASGMLFGSVFLSVVASTTALVRHNLPEPQWTAGIAAYTIVFAIGQIMGPSLVGWVADGPGGLLRGFLVSAGVLALGAGVAARQSEIRKKDLLFKQ
ncbi:MAG: YbfB/YjiJ family MFS transporter [Burkholderiales bacterium]